MEKETQSRSAGFSAIYNLVKYLAMALGFVVSLLGLMSLVGSALDNLWIQLGIAAVALVGLPLLLAELILPKDINKGRGMVTEIIALVWMGGALAFLGLGDFTGPLFAQEAEQLQTTFPPAATAARWFAGESAANPEQPTPNPEEVAKAETKTSDADAKTNPKPGEDNKDGAEKKDANKEAKADKDAKKKEIPIDKLKPMTPAEIFKTYASSVVTIEVLTLGIKVKGGGTGFLLDDKGTIATNHHVIDHASEIRVKFFEGEWISEVEILDKDPELDLALLRVKADGELKPVRMGDSDDIVVGERVISIGNPLGLEHTLTDGLVSSRRIWNKKKMIQMSAPVSPGNSGGPLFNEKGLVIGVTTAKLGNKFNRGENLNLAVPVNVLKDMIRADYPGRQKANTTTW